MQNLTKAVAGHCVSLAKPAAAARRPVSKVTFAIISSLSPKAT